jgi:anaerobic ribonucleoside-triphosphate reductase
MENKNKERTECQIFSRVTGWLVPRHKMNKGKIAEFIDRVYYKLK